MLEKVKVIFSFQLLVHQTLLVGSVEAYNEFAVSNCSYLQHVFYSAEVTQLYLRRWRGANRF